jgi:hypothetical protein
MKLNPSQRSLSQDAGAPSPVSVVAVETTPRGLGRGLLELLLLAVAVWFSLASSEDESSGGTVDNTPVETRTPCQDNSQCPGFQANDLCAAREECGADKYCTWVQGVSCPGPTAACQVSACEPTTGKCYLGVSADLTPCDDANPCTTNDQCAGGACRSQPLVCDAGNPCYTSTCVPAQFGCVNTAKPEGAPCSDGNACTTADACTSGYCQGTTNTCDDANPCTVDQCDPNVAGSPCTHVPLGNGDFCSDGNACTVGDSCQAGKCTGIADTGSPCGEEGPCQTAGVCEAGSCKPGQALSDIPCDDLNQCTGSSTCEAGVCVGSDPIECDPAIADQPCSKAVCSPEQGCIKTVALGEPCVADAPCAKSALCQEIGFCMPTEWKAPGTACDDGNPCTLGDACAGNVCQPSSSQTGIPCDDGNACTAGETCQNAACSGPAVVCDDFSPCTTDSCDPIVGCIYEPASLGAGCDDGNACTTSTACLADGTCGGGVNTCDDGSVCTDDNCVSGACQNKPKTAGTPCDGASGCGALFCNAAGVCTNGVPLDCDDGSACTDDYCDPGSGCVNAPVECDDDDACTTDSCAPATGCVFTLDVGKSPTCPSEVNCLDGKDNDLNGVVDCANIGCFRKEAACTQVQSMPWLPALDGSVLAGFGAVNPPGASWSVDAGAPASPFGPMTLNTSTTNMTSVLAAPPTTDENPGAFRASVCCFSTTGNTLLTWLEWVDWDTATVPMTRQLRFFSVSKAGGKTTMLGNESYLLPSLPADQGHWVRRTVPVPPNLVIGAHFEVVLPPGATGSAGPGWFVDDVAVLTQEDCEGVADTNADGRVGCADPTCKGAPGCIETTCSGGLDDDGDGFTDCDDEACLGAAECVN